MLRLITDCTGVLSMDLERAVDSAGFRVCLGMVQTIDFDGDSLRQTLANAVHHVAKAIADDKKVYVHCTAGLGRSPAACIAYLFWFQEYTLDEAYDHLTSIRPCGPKKDSIRAATYDMLAGGDPAGFASQPAHAFSTLTPEDRYMVQYHVFQRKM